MLSTKNDMKRICKKLLCVVFALSTLLSVSSCEELDSFHGELEWVESGDSEEKMLLYKENFYYYAHDWIPAFFIVDLTENTYYCIYIATRT